MNCLNEISTFHKTDPRMYYCIQRCTKNPFNRGLGVGGREGGFGHSPTFLLSIFFLLPKKWENSENIIFIFPTMQQKETTCFANA